jgi:hypothetical protein
MIDLTNIFLIVLLIIDFIMIMVFVFFYVRFKKVFDLPWEEIKESIEKAQELVKKLEELQGKRKAGISKSSEGNIKERVHKLAREGKSPREIAKKLGLSEAEVELILSKKLCR